MGIGNCFVVQESLSKLIDLRDLTEALQVSASSPQRIEYHPRRYQFNSFPGFWQATIGEDARGSSSKGLLVYPPLVLAATVCGYDRTRYVARTVQQLLLASTTRRRDGSRRNKREKA